MTTCLVDCRSMFWEWVCVLWRCWQTVCIGVCVPKLWVSRVWNWIGVGCVSMIASVLRCLSFEIVKNPLLGKWKCLRSLEIILNCLWASSPQGSNILLHLHVPWHKKVFLVLGGILCWFMKSCVAQTKFRKSSLVLFSLPSWAMPTQKIGCHRERLRCWSGGGGSLCGRALCKL